MKYNKNKYLKPQLEIFQLMTNTILQENSGEAETGLSKETTFTWNDEDTNDLWGDEPEEGK